MSAFIIHDKTVGLEFLCRLLSSSDFQKATLSSLGGKGPTKQACADAVYSAYTAGRIRDGQLVAAFSAQNRVWLSFRVLSRRGAAFAVQQPIREWLHGNSLEGWFGPFSGNDGFQYLLRSAVVPVVRTKGTRTEKVDARWTVVARLSNESVGLAWTNNLGQTLEPGQFPYWTHVANAWRELRDCFMGPVGFIEPPLSNAVLDKLWAEYRQRNDISFEPLRVRAERQGVALSAHSSVKDIKLRNDGIRRLTEHLAAALLDEVGRFYDLDEEDLPTLRARLQDRALQTLVKDWGPKSFEFLVEPAESGASALARCHVYFGTRPKTDGPDSLQHIKCFQDCGGAWGIWRYFEEVLGPRLGVA